MKVCLAIQSHRSGEITRAKFVGETLSVGRSSSDIQISDPRCSRDHALFYVASSCGQVHIQDRSTNGTRLNGRRITDAEVKVGDLIQVGHTTLEVLALVPNESRSHSFAGAPLIPSRTSEVETISGSRSGSSPAPEIIRQWPELAACVPARNHTEA